MNAHLGDFCIASLIVDDSRSIAVGHSGCRSSLAVRGTIGYIAPEYAQTVHATTCGDVYSFGIVLMEMIIGKRPTDPLFDGGLSIANFVERNFPDQVRCYISLILISEKNVRTLFKQRQQLKMMSIDACCISCKLLLLARVHSQGKE